MTPPRWRGEFRPSGVGLGLGWDEGCLLISLLFRFFLLLVLVSFPISLSRCHHRLQQLPIRPRLHHLPALRNRDQIASFLFIFPISNQSTNQATLNHSQASHTSVSQKATKCNQSNPFPAPSSPPPEPTSLGLSPHLPPPPSSLPSYPK
jgi:hypothetical protein